MSRVIAVLGASSNNRKYGNKCVRAYLQEDWEVLPINPKRGLIEGLTVYRDLAGVTAFLDGRPLDRLSVYLPPELTLSLLGDMQAARPLETYFNPGSTDPAVFAEAAAADIGALDACSIVAIGLSPGDFP